MWFSMYGLPNLTTVPPVAKKRQYCTELLHFLHGALSLQAQLQPSAFKSGWRLPHCAAQMSTLHPALLPAFVPSLASSALQAGGSPLSYCAPGPRSSFEKTEELALKDSHKETAAGSCIHFPALPLPLKCPISTFIHLFIYFILLS